MKIHKILKIAGVDRVLIKDCLVLEWQTPGRAVFTVSMEDQQKIEVGQLVELSLAINDSEPINYFAGFIESLTLIQKNLYRILTRELAALLNQRLPISLRHCAPKQILESLSKATELSFVLEKAPWSKSLRPRFQHIGGGYMALDMIGILWRISHFCWHQQPDASIYVGSWQQSLLGKKTLKLPTDFFKTITSEGASLPIIPRLRPGLCIHTERNQHYVTQIKLENELMRLSWCSDLFYDPLRRLS